MVPVEEPAPKVLSQNLPHRFSPSKRFTWSYIQLILRFLRSFLRKQRQTRQHLLRKHCGLQKEKVQGSSAGLTTLDVFPYHP
jgi:hypothetical protein